MKLKLLFFTVFAFVFFITGCEKDSFYDEPIAATQSGAEDESESDDESEADDESEPDSNIPQGKIYLLGQSIHALANEDNFIWVVTDKKLIKWDKVGNEPTYFDLPEIIDGRHYVIKIDSNGLKWLFCRGIGLYQYDENQWIKEEFDLPNEILNGFDIDKNNNIWISAQHELWGTDPDLYQFDGTNWTHHTPETSGLMGGLTADDAGNIWFVDINLGFWDDTPSTSLKKYDPENGNTYTMGSWEYIIFFSPDNSWNMWGVTGFLEENSLVKFDGSTLTTICTLPPEFSTNYSSAAIDNNGIFWIGSENGVARYDGVNWTVFNNANSALYSNKVHVISVDEFNTKWVGTQNGLAALNDADLEQE